MLNLASHSHGLTVWEFPFHTFSSKHNCSHIICWCQKEYRDGWSGWFNFARRRISWWLWGFHFGEWLFQKRPKIPTILDLLLNNFTSSLGILAFVLFWWGFNSCSFWLHLMMGPLGTSTDIAPRWKPLMAGKSVQRTLPIWPHASPRGLSKCTLIANSGAQISQYCGLALSHRSVLNVWLTWLLLFLLDNSVQDNWLWLCLCLWKWPSIVTDQTRAVMVEVLEVLEVTCVYR